MAPLAPVNSIPWKTTIAPRASSAPSMIPSFTRLSAGLAEAEQISWNLASDAGAWDNSTFCYILLGDPELTIRRYGIVITSPLKVVFEAFEKEVPDSVGGRKRPGRFGSLIERGVGR